FEAKLAKLSPEAQAAHRTPAAERTGGQHELVAETARKVAVLPHEIGNALPGNERARFEDLQRRLKAFDGRKPAPLPAAMGLADLPGTPPTTHVLERGELAHRAAKVQPGFPAILWPGGKPAPAAVEALPTGSGRRLALARWIVNPDNP